MKTLLIILFPFTLLAQKQKPEKDRTDTTVVRLRIIDSARIARGQLKDTARKWVLVGQEAWKGPLVTMKANGTGSVNLDSAIALYDVEQMQKDSVFTGSDKKKRYISVTKTRHKEIELYMTRKQQLRYKDKHEFTPVKEVPTP